MTNTEKNQQTVTLALHKGLWVASITTQLKDKWDVEHAFNLFGRGYVLRIAPKTPGDFAPYYVDFWLTHTGPDVTAGARQLAPADTEGLEAAQWRPLWEAPGFSSGEVQAMFGKSHSRVGTLMVGGFLP